MIDRSSAIALALALLSACGGDPYEQPVASEDEAFTRAVSQLETEEKELINRYVARVREQGARPTGITMREAIALQRAHELELERAAARVDAAAGARPPDPSTQPSPLGALLQQLSGDPAPGPDPTAQPSPLLGALLQQLLTSGLTSSGGVPGGVQGFHYEFRWQSGGTATASPSPPPLAAPPLQPPPLDPAPDPGEPLPDITPDEMIALLDALAPMMWSQRQAHILEAAARHRFTTDQVVTLVETVPMSSRRLELLVALHPRVRDPENFERALELLTFDAHRRALAERLAP